MHPLHIVYINGPDIVRLALTDAQILEAVERALEAQGREVVVSEARVQLVPDSPAIGHFDVLRGVIHPLGLAGVKVVGDFVDNPEIGLPSRIGMLTLLDPTTGVPLAILNATALTEMRTGAMTALGAKHLARKDSKILGHIGAGGTSYWNIRLLNHLFEFDEIRVHSRRDESRRALAQRLSQELGKPVVAVDDWEACVRDADIVVEASRLPAPEPLLKTDWIQRGALVIPYGRMSAVELSLTDIMDKIVVDDRNQCRKGLTFGALRAHVERDQLTADSLHAELGQIVAGQRPGREKHDETILFWHTGLALGDIALGSVMLDQAGERGIGQTLRWE